MTECRRKVEKREEPYPSFQVWVMGQLPGNIKEEEV